MKLRLPMTEAVRVPMRLALVALCLFVSSTLLTHTARAAAAAAKIPQLQCDKAPKSAQPGIALACHEQQHQARGAANLLALAQKLEAAGLFDEAGHRFRAFGRAGTGNQGLEGTRRANALAELGIAQDAAAAGKARAGKKQLLSAMQTFVRQAHQAKWPLPAATLHAAAQLARQCRLKRQARKWRAMAASAKSGWFSGRAAAKQPGRRQFKVSVERCLGGIGYDHVHAAATLPNGYILAAGEATAADGDTQLRTWLLDSTGRTKRRADFGAGGPDRPAALALDGAAGAWVVGETDASGGSDILIARIDSQGRVRGHADLDGGGVDKAVAVVAIAPGRALALAEVDQNRQADFLFLRIDAAGKIRGKARVRRPGKQHAHAFVHAGGQLWAGGSDGDKPLLEAFDGAGRTTAVASGKVPGVVLGLAPQPKGKALWVVGRKPDGTGWLGTMNRKHRLKLLRRFRPVFTTQQRVKLLPHRRGFTLLAHGQAPTAAAWLATVGRRGKLKAKTTVAFSGSTGASVLLPAKRKRVLILGAAAGCGRGHMDGWVSLIGVR